MINLLLISDSPEAAQIKKVLQPSLKVIIDVVTDFDNGLKNVFEKRPATVCIQDQIGGVTGESVARHIKMLLGNNAPTFILLHSGDRKAGTAKGLFEQCIDLSQPHETVAENIINTLKLLLGDQWVKIYIPPPSSAPASVMSSETRTKEMSEDSVIPVDNFLNASETFAAPAVNDNRSPVQVPVVITGESSGSLHTKTSQRSDGARETGETMIVHSASDEIAELLLMERDRSAHAESSRSFASVDKDSTETASSGVPIPEHPVVKPPPAVFPGPSVSGNTHVQTAAAPEPLSQTSRTPAIPAIPAAADLRINQNALPTKKHISENVHMKIEENFRAKSLLFRGGFFIVLVCAVCAVGGWFLVRQKPQLLTSLQQRFLPSAGVKKAQVTAGPSLVPVQKRISASLLPQARTPLLPAFIPAGGHDVSYAVKNPGWERYVGERVEFRLFTASGRIQAIQVLAADDATISRSLIESVLREFAGSAEYQITSRKSKAGVRIENGKIQNKGEIEIYRNNGFVKAFVVSVN